MESAQRFLQPSRAEEIRPFRVEFPEETIANLSRRLADAEWPDKETVNDASQGVQLAMIKEFARYWRTDYDWRRCEAKLNALPNFITTIDGLDIHFIHVRSKHEDAMPLILTHGWPGSIIEMLEVIDPLTNPTAHGGRAEDAFHLVIPSLPGYGFSGKPTSVGWDPGRVAQAWAELMDRLGYTRYVAQGGDIGAWVSDAMARQAPKGLLGVHFNLLATPPPEIAASIFGGAPLPEKLSEQERTALHALSAALRRGYFVEQADKPQTIGCALTNTPVGLAAWILDHDPDSYEKIKHAFLDGSPAGGLTRDNVVDNISLYWMTKTATSSARMYWEIGRSLAAAAMSGQPPPEVSIPVAFTVFPGEVFKAPHSWAENVYPNLVYFNEADRGGHFAAWEEPELFATELRAAFKSMR